MLYHWRKKYPEYYDVPNQKHWRQASTELKHDVIKHCLIKGERGYYQMLLNGEKDPSCVLRFNINAFKNDYSLADLSKMNLSYFGVKVGQCTKEQLSLEKEFEIRPSTNTPNVKEIVTGKKGKSSTRFLDVYDIVLAEVMSIE